MPESFKNLPGYIQEVAILYQAIKKKRHFQIC